MASDLEDIVQRIALEGDAELVAGLKKAGEDGKEAFDLLAQSAQTAGEAATQLLGVIGHIVAALATAAAAVVTWTAAQDKAAQKAGQLAEAMGTTAAQLNAVEAAFAAGGVSAQQFERFAQRLTTTIAQQWPAIAKNIREAGTEADGAQERMVAANIRVEEANNNLQNSYADSAQKIDQANQRAATSFVALQFASQKAYQQMVSDQNSLADGALSLEAAQQKLATLQGHGPSDAQKKDLEVRQAQAAITDILAANEAKVTAQREHQALVAVTQKKAEADYQSAILARAKAEEQADLEHKKAVLGVAEANTALAEAENKAYEISINNIPKISKGLQDIVAGNHDAATAIDFTQVQANKLKDALLLAASSGGIAPTGLEALRELSKVLKADSEATEPLISAAQRLNLVQTLGGRISQQFSASASEILQVLEKGPGEWDKFTAAAKKNQASTESGQKAVHAFVTALESLEFTVSQAQQSIAALISPVLTAFLKEIESSFKDADGTIRQFADGITTVVKDIADIIDAFSRWKDSLNPERVKYLNEAITVLKYALAGLAIVIVSIAGAWAIIPVAIGLVILAIGKLHDAWDQVKDNAVIKFLIEYDRLIGNIIKSVITLAGWLGKKLFGPTNQPNARQTGTESTDGGGNSTSEQPINRAGGGEVHGPGSTTSDSVFARLSRGEFVVRASAVQNYGTDFMHKINSMSFPGFAMGGLVPSPVRLAGNSGGSGPQSTVNLHIDGQSFNGFKGPKATVDSLSSFAIQRQTSAAGRNPSWVR